MTLNTIPDEELKQNDGPRIAWIRVQDAASFLSPNNPKLHDMGSIIVSIERYGFQELPKFDGTAGWIKAGNGRVEALVLMEKSNMTADMSGDKHPYKLPRGLASNKSGDWVMPILVGTDARDEAQALAYLVDSNNLTLSGGDVSLYDMAKMWNLDLYSSLLQNLAEEGMFAITADGDTVDAVYQLAENRVETMVEVDGKEITCPHCGEKFSL